MDSCLTMPLSSSFTLWHIYHNLTMWNHCKAPFSQRRLSNKCSVVHFTKYNVLKLHTALNLFALSLKISSIYSETTTIQTSSKLKEVWILHTLPPLKLACFIQFYLKAMLMFSKCKCLFSGCPLLCKNFTCFKHLSYVICHQKNVLHLQSANIYAILIKGTVRSALSEDSAWDSEATEIKYPAYEHNIIN